MDYKELFSTVLHELGYDFQADFEEPKDLSHGDVSTNVAMKNARDLKKAPREIAQNIVSALNDKNLNSYGIDKIEIAGPGFINFYLLPKHFQDTLTYILNRGDEYGRSDKGKGKKVNVEYVSANPTGPLHVGHGRNAAMGDTIANLYSWNGYEVTKEYYFNNAGNQMNNLGKSIYARYIQQTSNPEYAFPEEGYRGEYIEDIAAAIVKEKGNDALPYVEDISDLPEEALAFCRKYGEEWNFKGIKETLVAMGIDQDVYYNEDSLYTEGKLDEVINTLKEQALAYEKDGATWLKLSEMGQDEDRVMIKSTGEPTYRLPDIAYHIEKFKRGYDIIVDVFGSDHIATIPDVMAAVKHLGYDTEKIKVVIHQFVTLLNEGEKVKMSKRSGNSYPLKEIIEEVGAEVTRFFLLMRSGGTHLDFDIAIAKQQTDQNPVFYLQYAHARVCSIIAMIDDKGLDIDWRKIEKADLSKLEHPSEINLIRELAKLEYVVESSADKAEPHIVADYLRDVAAKFHSFYHDCRIIGQEQDLALARLALATATRTVLKNGLAILGISAPEKM